MFSFCWLFSTLVLYLCSKFSTLVLYLCSKFNLSKKQVISMIHTSFTPEEISLICRYTQHAPSIAQCVIPQRPWCQMMQRDVNDEMCFYDVLSYICHPESESIIDWYREFKEFQYFIYLLKSSYTICLCVRNQFLANDTP